MPRKTNPWGDKRKQILPFPSKVLNIVIIVSWNDENYTKKYIKQ